MIVQKNRLDYIDRAKGILIILVVIGHIWQSGPVFNTIYVFHMPAFFVISGLLLGLRNPTERASGASSCGVSMPLAFPLCLLNCWGC